MARTIVGAQAWIDDDGTVLKGKHKGESIEDVADDDPGYLQWLLREVEELDEEDRAVVEAALRYRRRI